MKTASDTTYSPTEKQQQSPNAYPDASNYGYAQSQPTPVAVESLDRNQAASIHDASLPKQVHDGTPLFGDDPHISPKLKSKFVVDGYKDLFWVALFVINVLITIGFSIRNFSVGLTTVALYDDRKSEPQQQGTTSTISPSEQHATASAITDMKNGSLVGFGFTCVLIFVMLGLLKKFTSHFITASIGIVVVLMFLSGIAVALENPGASVVNFLFATFFAIWFYFARKRIPLASAMLEYSTRVVTNYPANFLLSAGACIATIIYFVFWCGFVFPSLVDIANAEYNSTRAQQTSYDNNGSQQQAQATGPPASSVFTFLYGLLMLYWFGEAAAAVLKVTVSGVVATHYFVGGNDKDMPRNPTMASFRRAMTYSFGSILFGSLLVAIVKLLHKLARSAARNNRNSIVACLGACLLGCLERLLRFFNSYAYCYIAIYGMSYLDAAKSTMDLMESSFVSAVINTDLTGIALGIVNLFDSLIVAAVTCAIYNGNGGVFAIVFLMSITIHALVFSCISAGVTCLFVCFAEEPEVLNTHHPDIRRKIDEAIEAAKESPCGGGWGNREDSIEAGQRQRQQQASNAQRNQAV